MVLNLSRLCAVIIALAVALTARVQVHADTMAVAGADVQKTIDTTLARILKSQDPRLAIGTSHCPPVIDLSGRKVGRCTLTVDSVALPVRVIASGASFKVNFVGDIYERPTIEKLVANTIKATYGLSLVAHCPGKIVQLLPDYTTFTCTVTGSPRVRSVRVRAIPGEKIFVYNVPGLKGISQIPDYVLTFHKKHQRVSIDGKIVAAFIKNGIAVSPVGNSQLRNMAISCPNKLDLTGTRHGECFVRLRDSDVVQRIDVWIDDAEGFGTRPLDAVLRGENVQALIQKDLDARLRDNGDTPDANVTCQKGLFAVAVHSEFSCDATVAGKRYKMIVTVQDYKGRLNWRGVEATPHP